MPEKTKENPSGSPLGRFSILNKIIEFSDKLTGYDRSKEYYQPKKKLSKTT